MVTTHLKLPCVHLQAPDGGQAIVSLFGAHVLSWRTRGGVERLYMSPRSALDGIAPIRGGVPLIFPQFANYGSLAPHGFARVSTWSLVGMGQDTQASFASFSLREPQGEAWPFAYALQYTVHLSTNSLELQLSISNEDQVALRFQAGLHTYLRVDDLSQVRIEGLEGARYLDRSDQDRACVQQASLLKIDGPVDRIYPSAPDFLQVREPQRVTQIQQRGFADAVIWNPGAARCASIPDMEADGYLAMLCLESASITHPVTLLPGEQWLGVQRLTV